MNNKFLAALYNPKRINLLIKRTPTHRYRLYWTIYSGPVVGPERHPSDSIDMFASSPDQVELLIQFTRSIADKIGYHFDLWDDRDAPPQW